VASLLSFPSASIGNPWFSVMPEIFYRVSRYSYPINNIDPGLKIAGVTKKGDRDVQE